MKKQLVRNLALGTILLCASGQAFAAGVEFEGDTAINNGNLTVGSGNLYITGDGSATDSGVNISNGSLNVIDGGITTNMGIVITAASGGGITFQDGTSQFTKAEGIQGEVGPTGPAGAPGAKGDPGINGADSTVAGPQGDTGSIGPEGPVGPKGDAGTAVTIMGSDTYLQITSNMSATAGYMWLVTIDDPANGATAGDGLVSGGPGVWTNVGPVRGPAGLDGSKGDTGDQGERGEQGVQGDQGIQGVQGITGPQGEIGVQGEQGIQGVTGLKGDTGETGSQGLQGIAGSKGDTGDTGNAGPQGLQGSIGDTGAQGIQGIQGLQGLAGPKGDIGVIGPQGLQGVDGPKGDTGSQGVQGISGVAGPKGDQGIQGSQGIQGVQGIQGDTGDVGPIGPTGQEGVAGSGVTIKGSDTYANIELLPAPSGGDMWIVTIDSLPDATAGDGLVYDELSGNWTNVGPIRGPLGPVGADGADGAKGDTGSIGLQGPQGIAGPKGDTGSQGAQGIQGVAGSKGDTGAPGPQGVAGAIGETGAKGDQGIQGAQGAQGIVGPAGPKGATGNQGIPGIQGAAGVDGTDGVNGATGATGATGEQGIQGEPGTAAGVTSVTLVMSRGDSTVITAAAILAVEEDITASDVPKSIMASQTAEHEMENILGSVITSFLVETSSGINFTGHFEDAASNPVPLSNTKLTVGAKVYAANGNAFMIETISGDGTTFGAVGVQQFAGTEFDLGATYSLIAAYGTEFTSAGMLQLASSVLDQTDDIATENNSYSTNTSWWYGRDYAFDNSLSTVTMSTSEGFWIGQSLDSGQTVRLVRYYANHANAPLSGKIMHHNGSDWVEIMSFDNRGISENWQEFAFPAVTGGTLAVKVETTVNGEDAAINEVEMYEYDKTHYLTNCVSAGTKSGFFTASWTAIKKMTIADQPNGGEACYTMSFDSPDDGKSYSVFDTDNGTRREIASSDPAVHGCGIGNYTCGDYEWYYRNDKNAAVDPDVWSKVGIEQNYLAAVSKAVGLGASNQMRASLINTITAAQWSGSGGFAENQTRFDMTVTLRTWDVTRTPTVSGAVLEVDQAGWEAKVVGSGGDYSVFSNSSDKTVNKQSDGTASTKIYYAE